ncbi:MAG: AEC family transporter [Puniceicoccaceae bacterium]
MDVFFAGFSSAFMAMLQIGIVIAVAGVLARAGVFQDSMITGASRAVVFCFLPCLIFDKITRGFDPTTMPYWWMIPVSALVLFLVGLTVTLVLNHVEFLKKPDLLPLGFMQNAGYFSIAIGETLVPEQFDTWAVYTFLFVLIFNPLLWTFGKYFVSDNRATRFQFRQLITPPLMGVILGIVMVLSGLIQWVPHPARNAAALLGNAAVPLSLVILGATIATTPLRLRNHARLILKSLLSKLVLIPAITLGLLLWMDLPAELSLLGLFWMLQAAYPQASNLVLQIRTYGGSAERVCAVLVSGYTVSLLTLPIWVGIWTWLSH